MASLAEVTGECSARSPAPTCGAATGRLCVTLSGQEAKQPRVQRSRVAVAGRPYDFRHDFRHGFASLLQHEGRNVIYVARQLGHDAIPTLKTYRHVMDELEDAPQIDAEGAIEDARWHHVRKAARVVPALAGGR